MLIFATRRYDCPGVGPLVDRMVRKPDGQFALIEGPEKPGDPEVEKPYSLEEVFEWLRECPWQIERTVIVAQ